MTDAPNYATPAPAGPPAGDSYPGKVLGIVALVLAILPFTQLIGLILGIVAKVQSSKVGRKNGIALAAIIIAIIFLILSIVIGVSLTTAGIAAVQEVCGGVESGGVVEYQGTQVTCP